MFLLFIFYFNVKILLGDIMKKTLKYVLLIIVAFITITNLTGCSKKSNIKEITLKELKQKIENKETFPLFIGNEGCSHCVSYKPILESVANDYDITVYHLDNSKLKDKEYNEFKSIINISGTPTVAFIEDGEEETTLNRIVGESTYDATVKRFKSNGYIK